MELVRMYLVKALAFFLLIFNVYANDLKLESAVGGKVVELYESGKLRRQVIYRGSYARWGSEKVFVSGIVRYYPDGTIKQIKTDQSVEVQVGGDKIKIDGEASFYPNGNLKYAQVVNKSAIIRPAGQSRSFAVDGDIYFSESGAALNGQLANPEQACLDLQGIQTKVCDIHRMRLHPDTLVPIHIVTEQKTIIKDGQNISLVRWSSHRANGAYVADIDFYKSGSLKQIVTDKPLKIKTGPPLYVAYGYGQINFFENGNASGMYLDKNVKLTRPDGVSVLVSAMINGYRRWLDINENGQVVGYNTSSNTVLRIAGRKYKLATGERIHFYDTGEVKSISLSYDNSAKFRVKDNGNKLFELWGYIKFSKDGFVTSARMKTPQEIYFNEFNPNLKVRSFDLAGNDKIVDLRELKDVKVNKYAFINLDIPFYFAKGSLLPQINNQKQFPKEQYQIVEYTNASDNQIAGYKLDSNNRKKHLRYLGVDMEFFLGLCFDCKNYFSAEGVPRYINLIQNKNFVTLQNKSVNILGITEFDETGELRMTTLGEDTILNVSNRDEIFLSGSTYFTKSQVHYFRQCRRNVLRWWCTEIDESTSLGF